MSRNRSRGPRLTLKAAKAIAELELGKSTGLTPHENNRPDFQRYEIRLGNYIAAISSTSRHPGVCCFSFAGVHTYYDIGTLQENHGITAEERRKSRREDIRDMASSEHRHMMEALVDEHGRETCRRMLDDAV